MSTPGPSRGNRSARIDAALSYAVLCLLIGLWVVLAVTLPEAGGRTLTFDVTCRSGNPVVGVWIESVSGGSDWARANAPVESGSTRFTYRQVFRGAYELRVGCGGSVEHWAVEARSSQADHGYRRVACDDVDFAPPAPAPCRDELSG